MDEVADCVVVVGITSEEICEHELLHKLMRNVKEKGIPVIEVVQKFKKYMDDE